MLKVAGGGSTPKGPANAGTFALTPNLLSQVEDVPVSTLVAAAKSAPAGTTPAQALPASTKLLMVDGKPEILYIGAEYCPFCAAERWALVMALSKFGTFTGLKGTSSSAIDTNPSTPTFSFYGSTYKSPYISFVPVELQTNTYSASLGTYPTLQTPTSRAKRPDGQVGRGAVHDRKRLHPLRLPGREVPRDRRSVRSRPHLREVLRRRPSPT